MFRAYITTAIDLLALAAILWVVRVWISNGTMTTQDFFNAVGVYALFRANRKGE